MTHNISTIWKQALGLLRANIGQVFLVHIAYIALATIVFTPLSGLLAQFLLGLSGQAALADQDIAYFLLTPLGMGSMIILAALLITTLVFEQASLMGISAGRMLGHNVRVMSALIFTVKRMHNIYLFAIRLVVRVLILILPFLAAAGAIGWLLMTNYDINYYLAEKPPQFLIAAIVIVLLLLGMLMLLASKLLSWSFALPLVLFTDVSPAHAFIESEKLTHGIKHLLLKIFSTWLVLALLLGALVLVVIQFLGSLVVPTGFDSLHWMVVILGALVLLWSLGNLLTTTFTSGSFASLLVVIYDHHGLGIQSPDLKHHQQQGSWRFTAPRLALLLMISLVIAVLTGTWLLNGIQIQDNIKIIAHRGAAGKAPENTLASIRQAQEDNTDWVEIDVQETADGKVVVIHDSDFMKLAGVDLKVWDGSLEQVQQIDVGSWFSPEFSAERVPTLKEVLETSRGKSAVVIELKYYGHDQQLEQRVVDIVEQTDMVDEVAIMSLKYEGINKIRSLRPDWRVGLLSARAIGDLSKLDADFLAVNMGMVTPGLVRRTRAAGKYLYAWTVNDAVSISRMISMGVNGIITDEPALARQVISERSEMSSIERLMLHTAVLFGRPVPQRIYRDQSP